MNTLELERSHPSQAHIKLKNLDRQREDSGDQHSQWISRLGNSLEGSTIDYRDLGLERKAGVQFGVGAMLQGVFEASRKEDMFHGVGPHEPSFMMLRMLFAGEP